MKSVAAIQGRLLQVAARAVDWPADVPEVFRRLARRPGCVWLDSAGGPPALARWSVLAAEPSGVLVTRGQATQLLSSGGSVLAERARSPFDVLREVLAANRIAAGDAGPGIPFGPGLYGYLSYDLGPHIEPKAPLPPKSDIPLPQLWFGLYEAVLVLDHERRAAWIVGAASPAQEAIDDSLVDMADRQARRCRRRRTRWARSVCGQVCNMTPDEFRRAVARAREYIAAGDIYQVNLSRRYTVALEPPAEGRSIGGSCGNPALGGAISKGTAGGGCATSAAWPDLYLRLRAANPAPYAAYIDVGEGGAVLSSSPELFLDLAGGRVVTRPIKGTRPLRPGDEPFNRRMRDELAASAKDRAELVMIVDLERNDLGRVAAYGSVRVTEPRVIEPYAAVYHTVAAVEGRLHADRDVVDLVKATFPGGSITGAPKVRAMQIIAELEPTRRSVYTGAVGYLGPPSDREPQGRCSLNIAIRTLLAAGDAVHIQVGGGIVADSQPQAEFDETADKARAMLAALGLNP